MHVKNILIVDDDADDTDFFKMAVTQINADIQVTTASSKKELFTKLQNSIPDLLFLDSIILTDTGLDCLHEIRNNDRFKEIPIIMYTGSDDRKYLANALEQGASAYIVKPDTLTEVRSVLEETLLEDWKPSSAKKYYVNGKFHEFKNL